MSTPVARPAGVTLVAVLTWISGALSVIGGVIIILLRDNAEVEKAMQGNSGTLVAAGVISIVVGLITIAVASGLLRGSGFARGLVTLLMLINIAAGIYYVIKVPTQGIAGWLNIGFALVVILLLWTGRASAFFRSR